MSEELAQIIREEIRQKGPMSYSRWMTWCLYHKRHGFYMKERSNRITGPGLDAEFATAPTLHPFLGSALAQEIVQTWKRGGCPISFAVVEYGGGEGGLAQATLAWLDSHEPALASGIVWQHMELSPFHGHRIKANEDPRIRLCKDDERPMPIADFIVANEFLDALPANVIAFGPNGASEIRVAFKDGDFCEERHAREDLARVAGAALESGYGLDLQETEEWMAYAMEPISLTFRCKAPLPTIIFVDYGSRDLGLTPQNPLRAFRNQRLVDSVLEAPGDVDITYNVDFGWVAQEMAGRGFKEVSFETQEQFLLRHGILEELNKIDRNTVEGASSYLRLRQLLLPTGMGTAFKVQRFDRVTS